MLSALYLYAEIYTVEVRQYTVRVAGLPSGLNGFTILHLSDLHGKEFGRNQEKLAALIKKQEYDLVAITGDLVNKYDPKNEPVARLLEHLKGKPVYFVPGNHDRWTGFQTEKILRKHGVHILINEAEKIARGDRHIWVVGVDDPYIKRDRLDAALRGVTDAAPVILLAHAPNIFPEAVQRKVHLLLVGHTHGGQVRLPFVGAVTVPGQGLFPEWDYGVFRLGKTTLIINAGLGESGIPLRFNCKPEIVLVTLSAESN
ncbi:MAG: metallophosphoesterase [Bacillota bacterium]